MLVPFLRTLFIYFAIVFAVRLMGKRQVGEMQPSELVITILISAVASVPMQDIDVPLFHGLVPIFTLIGAEVLISAFSMKALPFRKLLTGSPVPVIRDGVIDQQAAKKLRLSTDDIMEDLRLKDVFDLRTVKLAIVETNGQLSIMLSDKSQPVTAKMMSLNPSPSEPFFVLVTDGKLVKENLSLVEKTEKWLQSVMSANGAESYKQIFLLCADKNGNTIFAGKDKVCGGE